MPAKHTLHVALTEPLVRYVRGKVADGASRSASDVVKLALEGLMDRERQELAIATKAEVMRPARG
jgi:Arc/MetJ-type ribon-helix-helix transcriptional regulator